MTGEMTFDDEPYLSPNNVYVDVLCPYLAAKKQSKK